MIFTHFPLINICSPYEFVNAIGDDSADQAMTEPEFGISQSS